MGDLAFGDVHSPEEFDLDGHVDAIGVRYLGKARRQTNGKWRCLANVAGALCVVECSIVFGKGLGEGAQES